MPKKNKRQKYLEIEIYLFMHVKKINVKKTQAGNIRKQKKENELKKIMINAEKNLKKYILKFLLYFKAN